MATVPPQFSEKPGLSDSERMDLVLFIQQMRGLLSWVVYDGDSGVPDFLRPPLAEQIESRALDAELVDNGLSGSELRFKLVAFRTYYEAWVELLSRRRRSGGGPLAQVLQWLFRRRRQSTSATNSAPSQGPGI